MNHTTDVIHEAVGMLSRCNPALSRPDHCAALVALCHVKREELSKQADPFDPGRESFARHAFQVAEGAAADFAVEATKLYDKGGAQRDLLGNIYTALPSDPDELASVVLSDEVADMLWGRGEYGTPQDLCELAVKVLGIEEGDTVADFGAGIGNFLSAAAAEADCGLLYGAEYNERSAAIAQIRLGALGCAARVDRTNMFLVDGLYDKCFSNYPFGARGRTLLYDLPGFLDQSALEGAPCPASGDWLYNMFLATKLAEGGKAVGIMTMGAACNGADEQIRKHFVEKGWLEAVIALPEGVFSPYTNIATAMVVISKGNDSVRFVDAEGIFKKGRRDVTIDESGIAQVVRLLGEDCDGISCTRTCEELAEEGYILSPERLMAEKVVVANGVSIADLTESISRGSTWTKSQLEELHSATPTGNRYLMLQHIVDGEVEADLPYLTEIDEGQERYCVESGDVLLSKMGPNFKVAVAEVGEGEKVLATGNLFIIKADCEKVDPVYLKLCLESEQGAEQLRRACVGTAIPSLTAKGLADVLIPLIPLEEQEKVVAAYVELRDEIDGHKRAIAEAREKMADLLG